ncbi:MAG TPA: class I SAM-dependent methyltransferase [Baekduia sp.]|nr:class I SAM-dependent methyltransferase [Baekduia sp.]
MGAPADIEGWLTDAQADRLRVAARRLDDGATVVEIGSFRGKSAVVLAAAAPPEARVICIDPHLGSDRGPQEIAADHERGEDDYESFHANLARHGVTDVVEHVRALSSEALDAVDGPIDLLYVDGAHRFGPAGDDLVRWGGRVRPDGTMLVHDSFSSIGVTLALLRHVTFGAWTYVGRSGSMAEYRRSRGGASSALRQLAQLPWFARNVVLKALILARLRRGPWPY